MIVILAGEGGHCEQALRFASLLKIRSVKYVILTEYSGVKKVQSSNVILRRNISKLSKSNRVFFFLIYFFIFFSEFIYFSRFANKNKINGLVAFGPVFCLPYVFAAKAFGIKTIFIESWSKFKNKSKTGLLLEFFVSRIYIQNIGLSKIYLNSIYSGRL